MKDVKLHSMKEIKIIIEGEHVHFVTNILDQIKASGYTIFNELSGKGHHGYHQGHLLYNDSSSLQMIVTVVPLEKLDIFISGMKPILDRHPAHFYISDVEVLRPELYSS